MTPDSPVSGPVRLNFSQNNVELVSRVFGTQVFRRSFQPFRCSGRLYEMYPYDWTFAHSLLTQL